MKQVKNASVIYFCWVIFWGIISIPLTYLLMVKNISSSPGTFMWIFLAGLLLGLVVLQPSLAKEEAGNKSSQSSVLKEYIRKYATIGAIILPVLTVLWAVFILKFLPILVGFLPCSILVGVLFGGLIGSILYRVKYGLNS